MPKLHDSELTEHGVASERAHRNQISGAFNPIQRAVVKQSEKNRYHTGYVVFFLKLVKVAVI